MDNIMVIGATGQIGSELTPALREKYGNESVVATYLLTEEPDEELARGPLEKLNILNRDRMAGLIEKYDIDSVFNLAAILSAKGEKFPAKAFQVNVSGFFDLLELGRKFDLTRIMIPSSIGVFGPEVPTKNAPNETVLRPTSMYGVTKVTDELLGNYYFQKFGLDVRGLRLPGIISSKTLPGGGTTDYAVEVFYEAIKEGHYTFFVREDTTLPLMYMPDCVKSLIDLAEADLDNLEHHCDFNVSSMSFSAGELARKIEEFIPGFTYDFQPDERQEIADSWPNSIDDSPAREEWSWKPNYGLESMVKDMIEKLEAKLQ
ncbi:NAD-dependent epimerase/dehydratase family protein [Candidatus Bipolaricaulota bacterium]|nr:NAD-dependent epimerase/dehydratase family protein [Candidatus Bipolaricaulota bacterium]